ncbi:MAG TPA: prenyltransferase/squalene oxidase repeat-containing protein [Planctomycetota bacterium]
MSDESFDPESVTDRVVKKTPWWAISVGLHTLAVLVLTFLFVAGAPAETVTVSAISSKPPKEPPVEFRDPVIRTTPFKEPTPDEVTQLTPENERENVDPSEFDTPTTVGDNKLNADSPFKNPNKNSSIGVGGPGGGKKGDGIGGREYRRQQRRKVSTSDDDAVRGALLWLARHQSADGSWGVQSHAGACKGTRCASPESASADFDMGVTGLSLLAFLGAGYSHLSKDVVEGIRFGDVVRGGLQHLLREQDVEGFLGPRTGHKQMYNHAIAALALCEGYGLTGSALFKDQAQKAVDYLVQAQNPGRGWRYDARSGDNDTSVTGWAVMVLKSAELSGLTFPKSAYDGARAWLDEATEESYGRAGYTHKGTGKVYCPHNATFDHQEALTSIAVMSRIFIDKKSDARIRSGAELVAREVPSLEPSKVDYYAWYYAALALFQFDGPDGALWSKWNKGMVQALVKSQLTTSAGCKDGSWEPADRWGCEGGRVYATAINALTLEVFYRYENVLGGKRK